jgi:hypothetical protein
MLPKAERCPYACSMPEASALPANIVPFMCTTAADPLCAARTSGMSACCEPAAAAAASDIIVGSDVVAGAPQCCVEQAEVSTAMACRPPSYAGGGGNAGFVHILGGGLYKLTHSFERRLVSTLAHIKWKM